MKKAFDQTVRDIKREVNKKVLKVPSIEQKVLDATSNEPWGPHGSLLADVAHATKNYHEYQMIMSVLWKRVNDTGKNWRHVYKALTVLEYLVAHGSERVIDEIREHAYQISTLSDFQYIDSNGRDQGNNVRKKSQSLVVLVNDKERIQEVRQKAASNKDKYQSPSMGNMYRPGSFSSSGGYGDRYDDDRNEGRYGNRDDDRNGYGRERDWSSRDDSRYGRYGDSYGREGDKYSRDYEERYGRDGYKDDDYRGRGQNVDDYHYGSRSRSVDGDREKGYEDDGQYSSRGSGAKADDHSQDGSTTGKRLDRKYSEQNLGAPPTYEDAVNTTRSPTYSERDAESSTAFAPKASSPPTGAGPSPPTTAAAPPPVPSSPPVPPSAPDSNQEVGGFDEFDPRGSFSAAPTTSVGAALATSSDAQMDPLDCLSESFSSNSLALVPTIELITTPEANASADFRSGPTSVAASSAFTNASQPFDDPFGDGPFRAVSSSDGAPAQQQIMTSANSFVTNYSQGIDMPLPVPQKVATESGNTLYNATYMPSGPSGQPSPANTQFVQQELSPPYQDVDILADILPPSASLSFVSTQTENPVLASQSVSHTNPLASHSNVQQNSFQAQTGQPTGFPTQLGIHSSQASYPLQSAESVSQTGFLAQSMALTYPVQVGPSSQMVFHSQTGQPSLSGFPSQLSYSQAGVQTSLGGQSTPSNPNYYGAYNGMVPLHSNGQSAQNNFLSQPGSVASITSQIGPQAPQVRPSSSMAQASSISTSTGSSAIVPQPSKDKFETKSSVWADTLSRGLVNLNISGPKTNPLADIGVDFDAINRKEKRMEKPTTATVTSTVSMGKAMGSGSGMGRAGAGALRPPQNPIMNSGPSGGPVAGMGMGVGTGTGTGMGMGMAMGMGMGMGGYGASQPMGRPMNMPGTMGMNMGTGQGIHQMPQQTMNAPGSTMPGGYNPMMGAGNYSQQPYGGGYR